MSDETLPLTPPDSSPEERLEHVLAGYLRQVEQGVVVDQQALLAAHPDLADDLREFFGNQMRMQRLVGAVPAQAPRNGTPTKLRYFGDYEILEEIAHGGMGVVYKARQTSLNRVVAVKMILAGQLANESDVKRFQAEAEAAANLHHPGIVGIYEVGVQDGQHYYSMEYIEGRNLAQTVREKPLPVAQAAEYVRDMAVVLEYAHGRKVLHRDMKPSNVLIDSSGRVRITDFGLAKRVEGESDLTMTGQVLGTPSYMSPEQAAAQHAIIGPATDIYALGAILYELLTGRPPFRSENIGETLRQVQHDEPVRPRLLNPKLPRDLETICLKCLEKEPRRRYATAQTLADDLGRYRRGEPIFARPISPPARAWRWCKRTPVVAGLLAAVASSLIVGTGVSSYFAVDASRRAEAEAFYRKCADDKSGEADREKLNAVKQTQIAKGKAKEAEANAILADKHRIEAEKQGQIAINERDHARDAELLGRRRLYASQINLAHQALEMGHVTRVLDLLESQRPQSDQEDLRTFEWYYLWRLCHSAHRLTLTGHTGHVAALSISPDGTKLASGSSDSDVKIWDLVNGRELKTLKGHRGWAFCVVFSPDGKVLATGAGDQEVRLWDIATWKSTTIMRGGGGMIRSLAFSRDGNTLAVGTSLLPGDGDGIVKLWNIKDAKEIATLRCESRCVISVAISPDGTKLASASAWGAPKVEPKVKLWDLTTQPPQLLHEWEGASSVAFSPDGTTLAATYSFGSVNRVRLLDVASGKETASYQGHATEINSVAYSPDGKMLAMGCNDRTVRVWEPETGKTWTMSHLHVVTAIAFAPDGKTVASASFDRTVKVWNVSQKPDALTLQGHQAGRGGIAFSPDGNSLAYAATGSVVRLCNPTTGETHSTLFGKGDILSWVTFSRDSKHLAAGATYGSIKYWDIATVREVATFDNQRGIYSLALSPDGKTLVASAGEADEVQFWDLKTQHLRARFKPSHYGGIGAITYSPDGKTLVTADKGGTVDFWNPETLTRKLRCDATEGNWIWALVLSPDGKTLVTGGEYGFLWAWDAKTGKLLATFRGHTARIMTIAFFPDSKTMASGCDDGTVKLWDVPTGQERLTLLGHNDRVVSVAIAPDGKTLATGSMDGTMRLWRASADQDAK